jgi:GTP-binding protein
MLEWFRPTGKPVHVLLTKADKLSREAGRRALRRVSGELTALCAGASVQLFSSLGKTGLDEAESVLGAWLAESPPGSATLGEPKIKPPARPGVLK